MIVNGGGHTWPGGRQYLSESLIGRVTRDIGSDLIIAFVESHVRP